MAKFTLIDDKTEASAVTMHVGDGKQPGSAGHKRLHLAGVPEKDRKSLAIVSTNRKAVTASAPIPYDMAAGIWTVDLTAEQKGDAEIQAKVGSAVVARAAVKVLDKLLLPAPSSEAGLLARLFLAETASPEPGKAVQW